MSEFNIQPTWHANRRPSSELEATACALKIEVGGQVVSAFKSDDEPSSDVVEIPAYHLAEWMAENWWALLWEPRKNEDGTEDDGDFLNRHSTLAAQHGFHLPQIQFVSNGRYINVLATARSVPFSGIRFTGRGQAFIDRPALNGTLRTFVSDVAARLTDAGFHNSYLQECWKAVETTDPDAFAYCEMIGALGLSPYAPTPEIDEILDQMCEKVGEAYTRDLCLVARPEELKKTARAARLSISAVNSAPDANIETLTAIIPPKENPATQAWHRGRRAAMLVRDRLSISDTDISGANRLFETLGIDPSKRASIGDKDLQPEGAAIVGAVQREDARAKISFIQKHEQQRRFTAARGIFSAWVSPKRSGHLLTQAVTRHQQASRAFAAELLAPMSYIKKWQKKRTLTYDDLAEISQNLVVGWDVVYKQAVNNGFAVLRSA